MKQLKLRNPYSASPKVLWLLETAFYVVVAGFCLQVAFLFLPTGEQFALGGQSNLSLVVILIFCVAFLIFLANCILWVGMLLFVLKYDGRKTTTKGLWLVVIVGGLSAGAAIYYWFVYRAYLAQFRLSQSS